MRGYRKADTPIGSRAFAFSGQVRQSTGAIDQLERQVASLLARQKWFNAPITQRRGIGAGPRNDGQQYMCQRLTSGVVDDEYERRVDDSRARHTF
jgi:hypothetical protein